MPLINLLKQKEPENQGPEKIKYYQLISCKCTSTIRRMGKLNLSHRSLRLLIASTLTISIVSLILVYLTSKQNDLKQQEINASQLTTQFLQRQLAAEKHANTRLIENFGRAQEARMKAESQLADLASQDWQTRYQQSLVAIESLEKNNRELEFQHSIDTERLRRGREYLDARTDTLQQDLQQMRTSQIELENKYRVESGKLHEQIAQLEEKSKKYKMAATQPEAAKKEPDQQLQSSAELSLATADTGNADKSESYRYIRLNSLGNAMLNQDSAARKKILSSVIPTIPNGISGTELLALISGMDSNDILQVIQSTDKYISRPLDDKTLSTLGANMNKADAETANLILSNQ